MSNLYSILFYRNNRLLPNPDTPNIVEGSSTFEVKAPLALATRVLMRWGGVLIPRYTSHATGFAVNFEFHVCPNDDSCLMFQRNKIISATVQHYYQLKIELFWALLHVYDNQFLVSNCVQTVKEYANVHGPSSGSLLRHLRHHQEGFYPNRLRYAITNRLGIVLLQVGRDAKDLCNLHGIVQE